MTSQPLETIPEAPTPTPAPTPARVTAKNPSRVASSKRLAERSRLASSKRLAEHSRLASSKRLAERSRLAREAEAAKPAPTTTTDSASDVTANDSSLSLGLCLELAG